MPSDFATVDDRGRADDDVFLVLHGEGQRWSGWTIAEGVRTTAEWQNYLLLFSCRDEEYSTPHQSLITLC